MAATTKQTGDSGEQIAQEHLRKKGYRILETNWRFKRLEVDIIASREDVIVFVEVKTRMTSFFGDPEEAVNRKKQNGIVSAAHQYIVTRDIALEARFDVISVTGSLEDHEIKHIEGAFAPVAK
jgi:putative endonuclease